MMRTERNTQRIVAIAREGSAATYTSRESGNGNLVNDQRPRNCSEADQRQQGHDAQEDPRSHDGPAPQEDSTHDCSQLAFGIRSRRSSGRRRVPAVAARRPHHDKRNASATPSTVGKRDGSHVDAEEASEPVRSVMKAQGRAPGAWARRVARRPPRQQRHAQAGASSSHARATGN